MPKFNFEALHPNHKFAFLDGFLCGVMITTLVLISVKEYREQKAFDKVWSEANEITKESAPE